MIARLTAATLLVLTACGDDGGGGGPIDALLGPHTLTGTVRYDDRPQQSSGRLGTVQQLPARGISISLIAEDDGAVLAEGVTADDGTFSLSFDTMTSPEPVHLLAAAFSDDPTRLIQVLRSNGTVHGFGGAAFSNEATGQDLHIPESSEAARAFNVFDVLILNADTIRTEFGRNAEMLTARWEDGSHDGTYYRSGANTMHLLGDLTDDDDGYDDTVILHEAGHYVEDTIGRSNNPGGPHSGAPADPNLAWSEGYSTYWAITVKQNSIYGDSNAGGGFARNYESSRTRAPMPAGPLTQLVSENMVTEILWDMGDTSPATDDDPLVGDHWANHAIQPYMRTATPRNVGEPGIDLVDFLDGWFVADGLGDCAAVRSIVTTGRDFPYDYAGPAGPCPTP